MRALVRSGAVSARRPAAATAGEFRGRRGITPTDLLPLGRQAHDNAYDNKTLSSRFGINLADNFDIGLVTRYIDTSLLFTGDDFLGPESLRSTEADQ